MRFLSVIFGVAVSCSLCGCLKNVDENPIAKTEKLIGEYSNSNETLYLKVNGIYLRELISGTESGKWEVLDSNLTLVSTQGKTSYIKVIEVDGIYQLILKDKEVQDPDTWDWSLVMKKKY